MHRYAVGVLALAAALVGCGEGNEGGGTGAGAGGKGSGSSGGTGGASGDCSFLETDCNGVCLQDGEEAAGCKVLASETVANLALGPERLFYTRTQSVGRFDLDSLEWDDLVEGLSLADEIILSDDTLYFDTVWTEAALGGDDRQSTVRSVPTTGGEVTLIARDLDSSDQLRLAGSNLYLHDAFRLRSVPITGGMPTTVLYFDITAFALDESTLYFTRRASDDLYDPKLRSAPIDDPVAVTELGALGFEASGLYVDATHVYFTGFDTTAEPDEGVLARMPKAGGTVERLASGPYSYTIAFVDDDGVHVFEIESGVGTRLVRFPHDGATSEVIIADRIAGRFPVAADDTYYYVSTTGLLRIVR